jgi:hypothetical protein
MRFRGWGEGLPGARREELGAAVLAMRLPGLEVQEGARREDLRAAVLAMRFRS